MKFYHKIFMGAASALLLTGCIDNNYDLSDIDTTSEFKVKDLTLPVQLDPVLLSDIIKVKEGDKLKEVTVNGQTFYAVEQTGEFKSDGIDINSFSAKPESMQDKVARFTPNKNGGTSAKRRVDSDAATEAYYLFEPVIEQIEFDTSDDIDGSIRALNDIYFKDLLFRIDISSSSLSDKVTSQLENTLIYMPQGLTVSKVEAGGTAYSPSSYDPATGILNLSSAPVKLTNNSASILVTATAINLSSYDKPFIYDEKKNAGSFRLVSEFNIQDCTLKLSGDASEITGLQEIIYNVHYSLDPLEATSIMGNITYNLSGTGLEIEPINLEDIPSFLDDPETNLILSNPQIYLKLNNPIGQYGLGYQSSLDILVSRKNAGDKSFTSPLIKVPVTTGAYNYLLAPHTDLVTNIPEYYQANIEKLTYENLGNVLAGEGLPKQLDIDLIDPVIPEQPTTSPFQLNQNIPGMEGEYMFLAPIALQKGSRIVKTIDGWWSEDLEDLTINILKISATATSTVPMGVELNVYPIDKYGNRIETATLSQIMLDAMAQNQEIQFIIEGDITDLDGIEIYVLSASEDDTPLAPSQVITLENLKANVTGNYTKKF